MTALLVLATAGRIVGDVGANGILFQHTNTVTTIRSRWLVAFVIDLSLYEKAFADLENRINEIRSQSFNLTAYFIQPGQSVRYLEGIDRLREELFVVKGTYSKLYENFVEYAALTHGGKTRNKKSLLFKVAAKLLFNVL